MFSLLVKLMRTLTDLKGFPIKYVVLEILVLMVFYIFKLNKEKLGKHVF